MGVWRLYSDLAIWVAVNLCQMSWGRIWELYHFLSRWNFEIRKVLIILRRYLDKKIQVSLFGIESLGPAFQGEETYFCTITNLGWYDVLKTREVTQRGSCQRISQNKQLVLPQGPSKYTGIGWVAYMQTCIGWWHNLIASVMCCHGQSWCPSLPCTISHSQHPTDSQVHPGEFDHLTPMLTNPGPAVSADSCDS